MASALSNRQNCTRACKTLHTRRGRTHGAGCVRQWFRTAEPLGERRYENWNTHTQKGGLRARGGKAGAVGEGGGGEMEEGVVSEEICLRVA